MCPLNFKMILSFSPEGPTFLHLYSRHHVQKVFKNLVHTEWPWQCCPCQKTSPGNRGGTSGIMLSMFVSVFEEKQSWRLSNLQGLLLITSRGKINYSTPRNEVYSRSQFYSGKIPWTHLPPLQICVKFSFVLNIAYNKVRRELVVLLLISFMISVIWLTIYIYTGIYIMYRVKRNMGPGYLL